MKLGHRRGLMTIVLGGLILFSCPSSASFIEHDKFSVIDIVPKLPRREHAHHSIHRHRHKARLYQRRTEGVLVEVPYTIWTGTFADLIKRSPGASSDSPDGHADSKKNQDKVTCLSVTCQNGYYCTDAGCCPEGSECTGISTCLDATDPACPKNIACCPKANPVCKITGGQGFCMQGKKDQGATTTSKTPTPTSSVSKGNPTTIKPTQHTTSIGGNESTMTTTTTTTTSTTSTISTMSTTVAILTQTSAAAISPTSLPQLPTPQPTPVDNPTDISTAPTPSSTAAVHEMSDGAKIAAAIIAGSIVFIAFSSMILYAIVKKRGERALVARLEEATKTEPMSGTRRAAPMGVDGQSRRLSFLQGPEDLYMSDRSSRTPLEGRNSTSTGPA